MGLIASTQPQLLQATTQQGLAQEEAAMRAQAAQQQAQMPVQLNLTEYLQVCQRLGSYGFGMPSIAGNAAMAYAAAGGQNVAPGFVYQGIMAPPGAPYSLHGVMVNEPAQVYQLEREAASRMAPQPQYAPVQVAQTAPAFTQQVAAAYNQQVAGAPNFLSPGAPESMPQLAQVYAPPAHGAQGVVQMTEQAIDSMPQADRPSSNGNFSTVSPGSEAPKKKGRPKKEASGPAPEATAAVAAPTIPPQAGVPATQASPVAAPTYTHPAISGPAGNVVGDATAPREATEFPAAVLINARASFETKSLAGYVDYVNAELSKRYSVLPDGKPGIQDVRCAPKDSPLAFGGWKGAVREVVKADPPTPACYHLDTHTDELNEAVADALRVVAERCGWMYVRGVR